MVAVLFKLGLTGGIACGKTTIAKMFILKGALLLDADLLAREVVEPGKPAWVEIVSWLGERVCQEDRTLDRAQIASVVFSNTEALQKLNSIAHPRIKELFLVKSKELAQQYPHKIQVWDIPLLFEIDMHKNVDSVLVVAADQEIQIKRIRERDGLSREEALRRISSQMDLQAKIRAADYVIFNNSTINILQEQVDRIWEIVTGELSC